MPFLIDGEDALARGVAALRRLDPVTIGHLLAIGGMPPLRRREPGLEGLAWIVISQQVSTASANAIFARLQARLGPFDPAALGALSETDLRGCGLSAPKIRTLHALAAAASDGRLDFSALAALTAPAAHDALVALHGVGPWTADIFLLFCLGHPDAWPAGDLALQEAVRVALRLDERPQMRELTAIGERWRPWRGVAARLLWAYYRATKQGRAGMSLAQ